MSIEIRRTTVDELRAASTALRIALLDAPPDDDAWKKVEPSWLGQQSFSAWSGEQCIGHVSYFDVDTTVPGGARLPTSAVTRAGVLPTHSRRGVFTDLMAAMTADARERGLVLASLRASETTIYERFGYGMAGHGLSAEIDISRVRPLRGAATDGSVELVAPANILGVVVPLYDAAAERPGKISRPKWVWERYFEEAVGNSKEVVAVHRSSTGELDGYVHYETAWTDDQLGLDTGLGTVHEIFAANAGAELALWTYLFDIDLVRSFKVNELAADSVLFTAAADPRAVRVAARWDEQWLQLLNVDAALGARSYAADRAVTIAVTDDRSGTSGTRHVSADGVKRSDDPAPDLTTDVAGLSAAYLGSTSWWELVASGRAAASSITAVTAADALFASRPLAFCGSFF